MKRNKTFIKEICVIILLLVFICFTLFFLFPVLNKEVIGFDKIASSDESSRSDKRLEPNEGFGSRGHIISGKDAELYEIIEFEALKDKPETKTYVLKRGSGAGLLRARPGTYLLATIRAKNIGAVDFPRGTVSVKWAYCGENTHAYEDLNTEKFQIFIDGGGSVFDVQRCAFGTVADSA